MSKNLNGEDCKYTQLLPEILAMTQEGLSLPKICAKLKFSASGFIQWLSKGALPEELTAYARAKEAQADSHAERIIEVAEQVAGGQLGYNEGRVTIEAYKWVAAKLKPQKYADRIEQHITGQIDIKPLLEQGRQRLLEERRRMKQIDVEIVDKDTPLIDSQL